MTTRESVFGGSGPDLPPMLTLAEIHGPGHAYSPRPHPAAQRWLSPTLAAREAVAGAQLSIAGAMPVLCSSAVASSAGLDLLREAGVPVPEHRILYRDDSTYDAGLRALAAAGYRIVNRLWHPQGVLPHDAYANPQSLLGALNNKACLARLVPLSLVPARRIVALADLCDVTRDDALPVVVKAVTDEPTGAGFDVRICRAAADIASAAVVFSSCAEVVVERFLPMERSVCLNYAAMPDGAVRYLGSAEQICDASGRYRGNWLDAENPPPEAIEGAAAVARIGAGLGYCGFLGVDLAIMADGSLKIFDLNFRDNSSTPALLLQDSIRRRFGDCVMRLRGFRGMGDYPALLKAARAGWRSGLLLPLASCDPQAIGATEEPPTLRGLVIGADRSDVERGETELAALGLL